MSQFANFEKREKQGKYLGTRVRSDCQVRKHTVWRLCIKLATYIRHHERRTKIFFWISQCLLCIVSCFLCRFGSKWCHKSQMAVPEQFGFSFVRHSGWWLPNFISISKWFCTCTCCVKSVVCYLLHFEIEPNSRESSSPLVNWLCKLIHHQSYATNDLSKVLFSLWRDLVGSVGILKMTSTQSVFLGRVASAFLLKSCLPPHYHAKKPTHAQTHMLLFRPRLHTNKYLCVVQANICVWVDGAMKDMA